MIMEELELKQEDRRLVHPRTQQVFKIETLARTRRSAAIEPKIIPSLLVALIDTQ